jgi:EF-P beta-lysylation protein EpmB
LHEILAATEHLVRAGSAAISGSFSAPPVSWQEAMRRAIRDVGQLRGRLGLPPADTAAAGAQQDFPTFVPLEFLSRIRPGDARDPLLLQVLPRAEETLPQAGFVADPVGDVSARVSPGLLHKYAGRALLVTTGVCGVHCRYCFRRQYDYSDASRSGEASSAEPALRYLRQHPEIDEVILSGGDPLTLSDARLDRLIESIEAIEHVARLRIHSRMPIVIPQRVTQELIARIKASRLATWMVIHCNHAQEIDAAVDDAIARLVGSGVPVLNQAVLLAGVNDDVEVMARLCRELVNRRVQPYYLHQLDRVAGAAHFEVPSQRGREIIAALRARLPGYAVPRYVAEVEGEACKRPLE